MRGPLRRLLVLLLVLFLAAPSSGRKSKKAKQKDKKPKKEAFQLDSESAQHVLKGSIAMRKYCTDVKDGLVEAAEAMEEMCPPGSTPKVLGPER